MIEINAKIRKTLGKKVKTLRKEGIIPAVLYGTKVKSTPLEIDYNEFEKVYKEAGESTIVKLKVEKADKNVLIYDVSKDPVTDKFTHIDFYAVRMDKLITTEVPLVFEGESLVVETEDGVLVKNITEVEVEALPTDLPREIKVDISTLRTFDDLIHIKDLKVSEGVKILAEPEEMIVSVIPPRSEEELAALEEEVEEKVEEVEKVEEAPTPEGVGVPTPDAEGRDVGKEPAEEKEK
jgi:large subunit ribosomal protein L25